MIPISVMSDLKNWSKKQDQNLMTINVVKCTGNVRRFSGMKEGVIIHTFEDYVDAAHDRVQHGDLAGNWQADGKKAPERWWFKS